MADFNEAFIGAKVQKAKRGKPGEHGRAALGHDRLPPGQTQTKQWPILDLGVRPAVAPGDWKLEVGGLVENPVTLSWEDFLALPQSALTADMHCVTAWSRFDNAWEGVRLHDLAALVKPRAEAKFVIQEGYDGYTTNVPLEDFLGETSLLAYRHDGEALTKEHGGPVRVVIPHLYAWKGSKFIRRITFTEKDEPGFWEVRGYHRRGDPWREERYA